MDNSALTKLVIDHPDFRWMEGMRVLTTLEGSHPVCFGQKLPAGTAFRLGEDPENDIMDMRAEGRCLEEGPDIDFSDPATVGCFLALVREIYEEPLAHVIPGDNYGWVARAWGRSFEWSGWVGIGEGGSDVEALVDALISADPQQEAGFAYPGGIGGWVDTHRDLLKCLPEQWIAIDTRNGEIVVSAVEVGDFESRLDQWVGDNPDCPIYTINTYDLN